MKTIVISDIHGMTFWKDVVASVHHEDHVVFLGDYFDRKGVGHHACSQTQNFLEICALARINPNVHLLIGNHDMQYCPFAHGYTTSYNDRLAREFEKALMSNMDLLNVVFLGIHKEKDVIFSHAGISQDFLELYDIPSVWEINVLFVEKPEIFNFILNYADHESNPFGDDAWQSPLWIRPDALLENAVPGYEQVVGHTYVPYIKKKTNFHGDSIYFTCTFDANCLILE